MPVSLIGSEAHSFWTHHTPRSATPPDNYRGSATPLDSYLGSATPPDSYLCSATPPDSLALPLPLTVTLALPLPLTLTLAPVPAALSFPPSVTAPSPGLLDWPGTGPWLQPSCQWGWPSYSHEMRSKYTSQISQLHITPIVHSHSLFMCVRVVGRTYACGIPRTLTIY